MEKTTIRNVISHSFGIVTLNKAGHEVIKNLIFRQQQAPATATLRFPTVRDNQSHTLFRIMENDEDSEEVADLSRGKDMGSVHLELPPSLPAGTPVEVIFEINEQGRLGITAQVLSTGRTVNAIIATSVVMSEEGLERATPLDGLSPIGAQDWVLEQQANAINAGHRKPEIAEAAHGARMGMSPKQIFISYKSTERYAISALAKRLEQQGWNVWYDQRLVGGQRWWEEILQNVRTTDLFIFALTPASFRSVPCQAEYRYAHALRKQILPILLEGGVDVHLLPEELQKIQFVDYRTNDAAAWQSLLLAISKLPQPALAPNPLPVPPPAPVSPLGELQEKLDAQELNPRDQAYILHQLKNFLKSGETADGARVLLMQLRRHPDLRASIAEEIDAFLK